MAKHGQDYDPIPIPVLVKIFIAVINHQGQKQFGEEPFVSLTLPGNNLSLRETRVGSKAEALEDTAYWPTLPVLSYTLGPPAQEWHLPFFSSRITLLTCVKLTIN